MTLNGTLHLHPAHRVGPVRRRTFGSFVEHMARCVYTGIYEPDHPSAEDRKSTRLNSSHVAISYAVFRLKKKGAVPCMLLSHDYPAMAFNRVVIHLRDQMIEIQNI